MKTTASSPLSHFHAGQKRPFSKARSSSIPATTSAVLGYLLDLGVQTRLRRADILLDRNVTTEAKGGRAVESVISAILSSRQASLCRLPLRTLQRLCVYHLLGQLFPSSSAPTLSHPCTSSHRLADSIPVLLRLSASLFRQLIEDDSVANDKAKHQVRPEEWYRLLYAFIQQAALEAIRNGEGVSGVAAVFAYGEVAREDDEEDDEEEEEEEEEEDSDDEEGDDWEWEGIALKKADHHLLFSDTEHMRLFTQQLKELKQELISAMEENQPERLISKYPMRNLQLAFRDYVTLFLSILEPTTPLSLESHPFAIASTSFAEFSSERAMLMPEVDSDDEEEEGPLKGKRIRRS
ncbi:uncharacterized protein VTP21DRAFT_11655 [Calcarisporiella thermophila]|uniref:uncharacterized protein n=1 Tax=Calcarisporiella thermophila TaxID=911321 RepID=UPI003742B16B